MPPTRATGYGRLALVLLLPTLFLALLLVAAAVRADESPDDPVAAPSGVTLLQSDASSVTFEVVPPALSRRPVTTDAGPFEQVQMPGYGRLAQPGQPDLPQKSIVIALPPGAVPVITLLESDQTAVSGVRVAPLRQEQLIDYEFGNDTAVPEFEATYPTGATYQQDALFPAEPVTLGQTSWLRDQRVASVLVRPVQTNPVAGSLTVHQRLRVQISFTYPDGRPGQAAARPESDAYESLLRGTVLNYEDGRLWRGTAIPEAPEAPQASPCLGSNAYRIKLDQTGVYRLTHTQLAAAGFPASVAAAGVRMCHLNDEIAVQLDDADGNGSFNTGDAVIFYGQAIKTQETETNVYWLTYGGPSGLRMNSASGAPGGATTPSSYPFMVYLEEDEKYYSTIPMRNDNNHWYHDPIAYNVAGRPNQLDQTFTVNNKTGGSVAVSAELWGFASVENHNYQVLLNGVQVGTGSFTADGRYGNAHLFQGTVAGSALQEGQNTVTVRATNNGSSHTMLVNWVEVTPNRQFVAQGNRIAFTQPTAGSWKYSVSGFGGGAVSIYDVTNAVAPIRITGASGSNTVTFQRTDASGASYEMATTAAMLSPLSIVKDSPSNLSASSNHADLIIITDPLFSGALNPLVQRRTAQGLSVKTVYVQDIFDEFNFGLYNTEAIRDFLAHAYANWQAPATSYVLLAGEGTYDHRNITGKNGPTGNLVPVYLRSGIDSSWGETAADNQYVTIVGNDDVADMMIGRLPALNTAEMTTLVGKIVAYETAVDQPWQARHYFLSDNYLKWENGNCVPDNAGNFFQTVDDFIDDHFPTGEQLLKRTYYAPTPCYPEPRPSYFAGSPQATTEQFIGQYRQGNEFVIYTGHSAIESWGHERYVLTSTVPLLSNGDKTPIMLPMTCLEGQYHRPGEDSLSEAMLKSTVGGAVASYAPTGLQVRTGHDFLLTGFYEAIFEDDVATVGQAVMGAKQFLENNAAGSYEDLQDTFMLLGDPSMPFNIWQIQSQTHLPAVQRP